MEKFECWLVDDGDRDDRTDVDACDEGMAAEEFIQALEDNGYFSGGFGESRLIDVGVIDEKGIETCWSVSGHFITAFTANERKPINLPADPRAPGNPSE